MNIIREYQLNRKNTRLILRERDLRGLGECRLFLCFDYLEAVNTEGHDLIMLYDRYKLIDKQELERRSMNNEQEITIGELQGKLRRDGVHIDKCVFTCSQEVSEFHYMRMSEDEDRQKHVQNSIASNVARELLESAVRDKMRFDEELDTGKGTIKVTGRIICMTAQELDTLIQTIMTRYDVLQHPRPVPRMPKDMQRPFSSRGILDFITNNFPPSGDSEDNAN